MDVIDSELAKNANDLQSYPSSYKNVISTCSPSKKCPCEMWINCNKYVDKTTQSIRLKLKNKDVNNEIEDWYNNYFRFEGEFHNLYCSG